MLGAELSDDSLTVWRDQYVLHKPGALKRDTRARMPSGKRLALSLPRPTRKDTLSPPARERTPRQRTSATSVEQRVLTLELPRASDRAEVAKIRAVAQQLERQSKEHIKM